MRFLCDPVSARAMRRSDPIRVCEGKILFFFVQIAAASFQEYFLSSDCPGQAVSGAGQIGPFFNNRTITPTNATGDYVADCEYSDVTSCIPKLGCGKPNLYMLAGGSTKRTTPAGTQLWNAGADSLAPIGLGGILSMTLFVLVSNTLFLFYLGWCRHQRSPYPQVRQ